jgi:LuxR family maltose regulon positive regulatory protein
MVLDGDRRGALRQLDRSIAIAAPAHLKRAFLDEGPIIADLVDELCRRGREANSGGADMREQLLAAFCAEQGYKPVGSTQEVDDSGLQGSMSRREMQVLNLVAQRMSNREIGDQLGLTEGSVKWYMQQIYDKFGVRRRLDVARKARQLGLVTETVH